MVRDLMRIRASEYQILLGALRDKYGPGYSSDPEVGRLQAKLSMMMEAAHLTEQQYPELK